ncbi:hypothetical protein J2P12_04645, partial [Candidatus Bathyarchaeota archaeon]|nr:hypothetical protein [Candidatus Bathyarchaeota archaeon]
TNVPLRLVRAGRKYEGSLWKRVSFSLQDIRTELPPRPNQNKRWSTVAVGILSLLWGLFHVGMGYFLGLVASIFVQTRTAFLSAGFLIDGVLIIIFSVAMLAGWSGSRLTGLTAYSLSEILGVGLVRLPAPLWGTPFIASGGAVTIFLLVQTIRANWTLGTSIRQTT